MRAGLPESDPKRGVLQYILAARVAVATFLFCLHSPAIFLPLVLSKKKARCCGLAASLIVVRAGLPGGDPGKWDPSMICKQDLPLVDQIFSATLLQISKLIAFGSKKKVLR